MRGGVEMTARTPSLQERRMLIADKLNARQYAETKRTPAKKSKGNKKDIKTPRQQAENGRKDDRILRPVWSH